MIELHKAYISQAIYVASNVLDKRIRYKQESAEDAFGSFISAQSQQTNLPDDFDPTQPRLLFQAGQKQIFISQIATQLSLGFESAAKPLSAQIGIVHKNSREFHKKILQFRPKESLSDSALIVVLSFPSEASRDDLSRFIFEKFLKMPPYADIASSSVKVGYRLPSGIFLNIEADVYERRGGIIENMGSTIDLNTLPIVEMGISVKLDVNTRPKSVVEGYINEGPEELIAVMDKYLPSEIFKLIDLK